MSQEDQDSRIRSLVQYHYYRNRHLSSLHDADDLFQDAWIDLNQSQPDVVGDNSPDQAEYQLRQAVGRAAERAFGKLRKRGQRGTANVVPLGIEPAESLPDFSQVIDLKHQIESLPADERLVIEMLRSGFDGLEIAKQLELSPQAVTRRKQRAIEKLRQVLAEQP